MRHVNSIEYDDNGLCRIILDDFSAFDIDAFVVSKSNISADSDIDDDVLDGIIFEGDCVKAQKLALKLLNIKMRTEKQLIKVLKEKGIDEDVAIKTVEDMKIYGYIDDLVYARTYINYRLACSKKSWKAIFYDLKTAGVSSEIIESLNEEYDIDEDERAYDISENILKGKNDETSINRLRGILSRNGFSWDTIKYTINRFLDDSEEY